LEIDDFGTGYSSLSYLQRFPVETLKIDRSFVDQMDRNSESVAIVRAIMSLGKSLGLSVIAEGVERTAEAAKLKALGCHLAQGYLYGTPLPASALGTSPRAISAPGMHCSCLRHPEVQSRSGTPPGRPDGVRSRVFTF
jgi:EAL domain-containing protein (putative c-di-GMP-specific phosphodiesterase class I)